MLYTIRQVWRILKICVIIVEVFKVNKFKFRIEFFFLQIFNKMHTSGSLIIYSMLQNRALNIKKYVFMEVERSLVKSFMLQDFPNKLIFDRNFSVDIIETLSFYN